MPITCELCPHACQLREGALGKCGQRTLQAGRIASLNYGQVSSLALDPIEKKPLYHFYPGTEILSVGSLGCNLQCQYCQNYHIAHQQVASKRMQPAEVVALAQAAQRRTSNIGIAFTYNEPTVGFEFVLDTAKLAQQQGLKTVLVTNGYLQTEPWRELLAYLDALNIDVKAFTEEAYRQLCGASLAPVLRNVELALEQSHVELTYLVVPGINDEQKDFERFIRWVAGLSPDTPLHLTRYFPSYKLKMAPTPLTTLQRLASLAREHLNFVYLGNVGLLESTLCPQCSRVIIQRGLVSTVTPNLVRGKCVGCGRSFPTIQAPEGDLP
ncbi:MAG TPA: AmmeMemoRadiSam system radical SAM enzyme [Firmicutes bacterium]|jgi:pyruvate formate lyase activating enzyme|nr:AmmeMemoRadiSam system radical SAM enzyme [Bacillota bacterium]